MSAKPLWRFRHEPAEKIELDLFWPCCQQPRQKKRSNLPRLQPVFYKNHILQKSNTHGQAPHKMIVRLYKSCLVICNNKRKPKKHFILSIEQIYISSAKKFRKYPAKQGLMPHIVRRLTLKRALGITTFKILAEPDMILAGAEGLEPTTLGFGDRCSTN